MAALCFTSVFLLVAASVFEPGFKVDSPVLVALLVTGCALLAVELRLWGNG